MTEQSPTPSASTDLEVPRTAAVVAAPTPRDRAVAVPRTAAVAVATTPQDRALFPVTPAAPEG